MNPDSGEDAAGADSEPFRTPWMTMLILGALIATIVATMIVASGRGPFCSGTPSPISGEVRLGGGEYVMTARPRHAVLHRPRGLEPLDFVNNLTYVVWLDPGTYRVEGGPLEYRCAPLPRGWVGILTY